MLEKYLNKLEYSEILQNLSFFCITHIGKNLALSLMPETNSEIVSSLLLETTCGTSLILKKGNAPLSQICDMGIYSKILDSASSLSCKALLEIAHILKLSSDLKQYYFSDDDNYCALENLFSSLYTNPTIYNNIKTKVLDENTISDDASKDLQDIRRKKRVLEDNIKNKLNSFIHSSSYSKYIQESVITIRNDRFVIPVKDEYKSMIKGFVHDTSSSGSTVFIEPLSIFEANNEISSLKLAENIEIEHILSNLSALLSPILNELKSNAEIIGKIDFIFAKANYALSIDAIEPKINTQKYVNLISARHPLIDKNTAVPININIGQDFSTLVITGPNTGGKTVSLKTVGLLCLMSCSGLHIPAKENSSIYVFDNIFADIGDEQSIYESLSTFSAHMSNIIEILNLSTSNSLVLLDELGSGTDPIEGSSLAISILETFFNKGLLTISTTHYPEIKNYALINKGFENASVEFDVEHLCPTFKLLMGIPGKSNAFDISKKLGLNDDIINRAKSFINDNDISIEELLKNIYDDKIFIENEKETISKNSAQIELLRKSLDDKLNSIKDKETNIIEKAKSEARKILLNAKDEATSCIKEINTLYNSASSNNSALKNLNNIRNSLNSSLKDISTTISNEANISNDSINLENIVIGMEVFVNTFNKTGTILTLPNKSNQVQVQIGSAKLNVNVSNLYMPKNTSSNKTSTSSKLPSSFKSKTISSQINVIGYNVEEAIFVIDKYLDDCYISKLSTIRIVHGKGTGILRKGIHDFLDKNPHVKSYRLGTFGEGEMGVTVVELNL